MDTKEKGDADALKAKAATADGSFPSSWMDAWSAETSADDTKQDANADNALNKTDGAADALDIKEKGEADAAQTKADGDAQTIHDKIVGDAQTAHDHALADANNITALVAKSAYFATLPDVYPAFDWSTTPNPALLADYSDLFSVDDLEILDSTNGFVGNGLSAVPSGSSPAPSPESPAPVYGQSWTLGVTKYDFVDLAGTANGMQPLLNDNGPYDPPNPWPASDFMTGIPAPGGSGSLGGGYGLSGQPYIMPVSDLGSPPPQTGGPAAPPGPPAQPMPETNPETDPLTDNGETLQDARQSSVKPPAPGEPGFIGPLAKPPQEADQGRQSAESASSSGDGAQSSSDASQSGALLVIIILAPPSQAPLRIGSDPNSPFAVPTPEASSAGLWLANHALATQPLPAGSGSASEPGDPTPSDGGPQLTFRQSQLKQIFDDAKAEGDRKTMTRVAEQLYSEQGVPPFMAEVDLWGPERRARFANRIAGVGRALEGAGEIVAGAATGQPIVFGIALASGVDNIETGISMTLTGEVTPSATEQWFTNSANNLGASPETAQAIGALGDMAVPIVVFGISGLRSPGAAGVGAKAERGLVLQLEFADGMELRAFNRKLGQLRFHVSEGNAISNLPHGVSDSARRSVTRAYRRDLVRRIESFFANNSTARENALRRLRQSDIDHILDLQLNGPNARGNLKALHSLTNQLLGSQITNQLPIGERVVIVAIVVI